MAFPFAQFRHRLPQWFIGPKDYCLGSALALICHTLRYIYTGFTMYVQTIFRNSHKALMDNAIFLLQFGGRWIYSMALTVNTNKTGKENMQLPTINTYGNYSSDNYGAHCLRVDIGDLTVWFSYKTPVAFRKAGGSRIVRHNEWGPTTGKHLNAIDDGDKKSRVSGVEFERLFAEAMTKDEVTA